MYSTGALAWKLLLLFLLLSGGVAALRSRTTISDLLKNGNDGFLLSLFNDMLSLEDPTQVITLYQLLSYQSFNFGIEHYPTVPCFKRLARTLREHFVDVSQGAFRVLFPFDHHMVADQELRHLVDGLLAADSQLFFALARPDLLDKVSWWEPSILLKLLTAPQRQRMESVLFCSKLVEPRQEFQSPLSQQRASYNGLDLGLEGPFWMLLDVACLETIKAREGPSSLLAYQAIFWALQQQLARGPELSPFFTFRVLSIERWLQPKVRFIRDLFKERDRNLVAPISSSIVDFLFASDQSTQNRAYQRVKCIDGIPPDLQSTAAFEFASLLQDATLRQSEAEGLLETYTPNQVPPYMARRLFEGIDPHSTSLLPVWSEALSHQVEFDEGDPRGHFPSNWLQSLPDRALASWRYRVIDIHKWVDQKAIDRMDRMPANLAIACGGFYVNERMPNSEEYSLDRARQVCKDMERGGEAVKISPDGRILLNCGADRRNNVVLYLNHRLMLFAASELRFVDGHDDYGRLPILLDELLQWLYGDPDFVPAPPVELIRPICFDSNATLEDVSSLLEDLEKLILDTWRVPLELWPSERDQWAVEGVQKG